MSDSLREQMIQAGLWDVHDSRDPSQDIAAAWQIVERFIADAENEWHISVTWWSREKKWGAEAMTGPGGDGETWYYANYYDTAPQAICVIGLKIAGVIRASGYDNDGIYGRRRDNPHEDDYEDDE